jgi:hypothetical protein
MFGVADFDGCNLAGADDGWGGQPGTFKIVNRDITRPGGIFGARNHHHP